MTDAELETATELSQGFDAGNFANAYETEDYDQALDALGEVSTAYRDAFTLGFFASYELHEMGEHTDDYLEALASPHGRACVAAGYCDDRSEEEPTDGFECGWGMPGCLYDGRTGWCETAEQAIESCLEVLADELSSRTRERIARDLRQNGCHYVDRRLVHFLGTQRIELFETDDRSERD